LNVCGLVSKFKYDVFVDNIVKNKIICLSEIKADVVDCKTIEDFANDNGYDVFCKPRKNALKKSGGLCTFVANDIVKFVKEIHSDLDTVQWFCVDRRFLGVDKDLILGNVYVPPPNSPYARVDMFTELEMNLLDINYSEHYVMMVGDFNSHTSSRVDYVNLDDEVANELDVVNCPDVLAECNCTVQRSNQDRTKCDSYGSKLLQLCKTTGMCIFNGRLCGDEKGACTTNRHTTIDYVLGTPRVLPFLSSMHVEEFDEIFSDVHKKIVVRFKTQIMRYHNTVEPEAEKLNRWETEKENQFVNNLNAADLEGISNLLDQEDTCVNEINNKLTGVLLSCAERTLGYRARNQHSIKQGDKECRLKKQEYNRAVKAVKYHKTAENIQKKRKAVREYQAAIKKFTKRKSKNFHKKLRKARASNSGVYWNMLNKRRVKVESSIQELEKHFKALNEFGTDTNSDENEEPNSDTTLDDSLLNDAISEEEILCACKKLKNNKSPGEDNIVNEYIKASMPVMTQHYVRLFNKILDTGVYPESWSKGLIVPIYKKKGDRRDCNNYRGITLLSCVGKLFTAILNNRLKLYCEKYNIINENQAGFRANYSTVDHIFSLKVLVELFFNSKQKLYCAFIDYQKAFDTVWRTGLWLKLNKCGIYNSSKLHKIIVNMYEGVKSCVFAGNIKSEFFGSFAGVRQGEILSPMLFSLYVNDLENYLTECGNPYVELKNEMYNNYVKLLVLLYADDTIILSSSEAGLQKALNDLSNYCTKWKLKVNSSKTKVTIFSKRKPRNMPKFTFNNDALEIVDDFKYLGVVFKSNSHFNMCKLNLKEQSTKAMFALLSKGRTLQLPVDIMLEMFEKTVLPIMLYGCEVWGYGKNDMLDTVFLRFCKHLLGVKTSTPNCMVYGELGCLPVSISIKRRLVAYWLKLCSADEHRICRKLYNVLFHMHENNDYHSEWLICIRDIIQQNGFGFVWLTQGQGVNITGFKNELKCRLNSQFIQQWHTQMEESSKCSLYRNIKTEFRLESYLLKLSKNNWKFIVKLRCSSHKLPIETGRYANLSRDSRYCNRCNMARVGDEYHMFFECTNPDIVTARRRFLPIEFRRNCSVFKFVKLLNQVDDVKIGSRVASFIKASKFV